jgi:hypothetical protein
VTRTASAVLIGLACWVFLLCWWGLHHGAFTKSPIVDTGLYQEYGDAVARGEMPYRDFALEYPPGALPVFVLPSLGHEGDRAAYDRWFDRLMSVCACVAIAGAGIGLRALGAGLLRTGAALGAIAVSPLLLGSVMLTRFDWWPAALMSLALAALLHERLVPSAFGLGAAIAAKLWPAVLAPLGLVFVWRTRGARTALAWAAGVIAVDAAVFVPFALASPGGLRHSFHAQLARPLQLESLGGAVLIALHHVFGTSLHVVTTFGSQNLVGTGTRAAEIATTVAGVLALLAAWLLFARGEMTRQRLATYAAGSVAAVLAFGKVFSPQFMIWLIPLVPLAASVTATVLLLAALVVTQTWFPRHYWPLANDFRARESWYLLLRDLCVAAIAVTLVRPRSEDESLGEGRARIEALERVRTQVE